MDCDVLQADGGTRTASVTGGWVAMAAAIQQLVEYEAIPETALRCNVASTSVGLVDGKPMLDLCYEEDSKAEVDMNVVMTSAGEFVELQGTAEGAPFTRPELDDLLGLASDGIRSLVELQQKLIDF